MNDRIAFLQSLPKKILSSGALIPNPEGEILILKPSYREGWNIPGGIIEAGESPVSGLIREIREETGLVCVEISQCAVVDHQWVDEGGYMRDSLHFVFHATPLPNTLCRQISVDGEEIIDWRFVRPEEALDLCQPELAARMRFALTERGFPVMLTNGKKV